MAHSGDNIVLYLLIAVVLYFLTRKWLPFSSKISLKKSPVIEESSSIKGEVPKLLRDHGYQVVNGKQKIPISIEFDEDAYESRMYVDYIARTDDEWYIVMVAKHRKPLRTSGPALRDLFLPIYLLYQPDGILYINRERGTIKKVNFDLPACAIKKDSSNGIALFIFGAILGCICCFLFFK
jgi:hypothetical protein